MAVELIETEDAGRAARCLDCGWHGIPTYEHGRASARCPHCGTAVEEGAPRVGRNDPCTCGSAKKYKRCCGR